MVPDSTSSEESTEAPPVNPTDETTSSSSESDSNETDETSESSESSEMGQIQTDCGNATESCESEEYFFQGIGDDGQFSVGNLLAPDESERELHLKR